MAITASDLPALGMQPYQVAPPKKTYPFSKNRDYDTYIMTRMMKQAAPNFIKGRLGIDTDSLNGGDPLNYLCDETDPEPEAFTNLVKFQRMYCRIPTDQITYPGSRYFTKPEYTAPTSFNPFDVGATSEGAVTRFSDWSFAAGNATYTAGNGLFTDGDSKVYSPVKIPSAQVVGYATGGTFTLTYGANTTAALNYNDSGGTVATAINGLASIIAAGITVAMTLGPVGTGMTNSTAGGGLDMTLSGGTDAARQIPITMNAGSLTVSTSKNPVTSVVTANNQQIKLPTHLTVTSHGLSASLDLALVWNIPTTFLLPVGYWGVIDANTLWVAPYGNNAYSAIFVGTYSYTYSGTVVPTSYVGGIRLVRTRVTEKYYLPGITVGINSAADITVPVGLQNPQDFLAALLTPLTGWQTYESSGPSFWMNGPIYVVFITEINFSDLI